MKAREVSQSCPQCGCHTHDRVDERKPDGSFAPGENIRCVNCKRVTHSLVTSMEEKARELLAAEVEKGDARTAYFIRDAQGARIWALDAIRAFTAALASREDVVREASFLCARLREFEPSTDQETSDYFGHIIPSVSRLEALIKEPAISDEAKHR